MKLTMNNRCRGAATFLILLFYCAGSPDTAKAASWNGIEPFKTRRTEVLKILGKPISESAAGVLRFEVVGGTVWVSFVDEKFVNAKKLRAEVVGTVLEIVLQHERSSDTPESMRLLKNRDFVRDEGRNASVFRNLKEGIVYTFVAGKLRTTRFTFSAAQLGRARRSGSGR